MKPSLLRRTGISTASNTGMIVIHSRFDVANKSKYKHVATQSLELKEVLFEGINRMIREKGKLLRKLFLSRVTLMLEILNLETSSRNSNPRIETSGLQILKSGTQLVISPKSPVKLWSFSIAPVQFLLTNYFSEL